MRWSHCSKPVVENDFGILVFSPDDVSTIRGTTAVVPRGNVIFEAALFIGKHGRDRCFIVHHGTVRHSSFRRIFKG
jgi:predicted nucleotide-binding protein